MTKPIDLGDGLAEQLVEQLPIGVRVNDYSRIRNYLRDEGVNDPDSLDRFLEERPDDWIEIALRARVVYLNREARRIYKVDSIKDYNAYNSQAENWENRDWKSMWARRVRQLLAGIHLSTWELSDVDFESEEVIFIRDTFTLPPEYADTWSRAVSVVEDIKDYRERRNQSARKMAAQELPKLKALLR